MNSTYSSSGPPKFNSNKHSLLRKLTKIITFKDDTGATPIYVQYKNADISNYLQLKTTSSQVYFPENSVIQSTHFFHLPLSSSPPAETQAHTHLNLQSARLFFFDSDCSAIFTKMISPFSIQITLLSSTVNWIYPMTFRTYKHPLKKPHHPPLIPYLQTKMPPPFR